MYPPVDDVFENAMSALCIGSHTQTHTRSRIVQLECAFYKIQFAQFPSVMMTMTMQIGESRFIYAREHELNQNQRQSFQSSFLQCNVI